MTHNFSILIAFITLMSGCSRSLGGDRPSDVEGVIRKYGPSVQAVFARKCRRLGIAYPPKRIQLLAFKDERILELWAANRTGRFKRLATYPIFAASGTSGPKKREGDRQVPEGFYRITHLNPLSQYHLSLRVDYPNSEDVTHSEIPRNQMGGDIYVHGSNVSIGCIAIGDSAIEKVFCLAAQADRDHRRILIAPVDMRRRGFRTEDVLMRGLYARMHAALRDFPVTGAGPLPRGHL